MMTPALNAFADVLSPASGTPSATPEAGGEGAVFNQIMVTMSPVDATTAMPPAAPVLAADSLPVTDILSLLPGLGLAEGELGGEPVRADTLEAEAAPALAASERLLPDWLPAMPTPALPLLTPLLSPSQATSAAAVAEGTATISASAVAVNGTLATLLRRGVTSLEALTSSDAEPVAREQQTAAPAVPAKGAGSEQAPGLSLLSRALMTHSGTEGGSTLPAWSLAAVAQDTLARPRDVAGVAMSQVGAESGAAGMAGPSVQIIGGREVTVISMPQHALQSLDWGDAFNQHLVTLAQQGSQTASLQLNPADLGPIEIKVTVNDKAASIEFASRHSTTSDLIESALPRLAGALEAHGLRLDEARVSQLPARAEGSGTGFSMQQPGGDSRGQANAGQASAQPRSGLAGDSLPEPQSAPQPPVAADDGRIDYYA